MSNPEQTPELKKAKGNSTRARVGDKSEALAAFQERVAQTGDQSREEHLAKRRKNGARTARENLEALCDAGTFVESGQFALAAQRSRRTREDLIAKTSGDGVITGIAKINSELVGKDGARAAVAVNDYSVLAATQGYFHHKKLDRIISLAETNGLPLVMYTEGGGGRPGDTDVLVNNTGLEVSTFAAWAALDSIRIAVNRGYCFAGNALLFGCADFRIATSDSSIGMAGPAMIEGGGLGKYRPEEVGPAKNHFQNGAIDFLVDDEEQATSVARQLLSYFQGPVSSWDCVDQSALWDLLPDDRRFSYDVRRMIDVLADTDSFLEYQSGFGRAIVCGFVRIEGKPLALIANDTRQLGGALDADASTKCARFLELCNRGGLSIVSLCDTPGFMVGPESEKQGAMLASASLLNAGAKLKTPLVFIALRKAYGLGAMAMAGGSFARPLHTAAWPTGEFGAMGLEGAVHLGYKKELDAIKDEAERQKLFDSILAKLYAQGSATEIASFLEVDSVIEPSRTRALIKSILQLD